MRTVELFCGTKSFSKVAKQYGADTFTTDIDPVFEPSVLGDVRQIESLPGPVDILWASPPCEGFSIAAVGKNWNRDYTPKHARAELAVELLGQTMFLISQSRPTWWFIENPRGMMRKMPWFESWLKSGNAIRHTITYCQYGDTRMKPTDIWTNAHWWTPKPMCKRGSPCHEAAPRGSSTGTQGIKTYADRSRIPAALFEEIFDAYQMHIATTKLAA